MTKIKTVYSLKELHDLLIKHDDKKRLTVWFDIDLTLVHPDEKNENVDVLIEKEITQDLFKYIMKNNIYFALITARFYDIVCNEKKRDLKIIKENIYDTIFPFLEELGVNVNVYRDEKLDDQMHLVKNEKGRTVGMLYHGIFFSGKKGETIKHYKREFGLDKSLPDTVFIDDHDTYLNSVVRHVPHAIVLKREI